MDDFNISCSFTDQRPQTINKIYLVCAIGEDFVIMSDHFCIKKQTHAGLFPVISWNAIKDAKEYVVFKFDQGIFGYIGTVQDTKFIDCNITPDIEIGPKSLTCLGERRSHQNRS